MALKRQHDTQSMFSMASMTDVIFLLLIFFLMTSTAIMPSALEVNLPESSQQTTLKPMTRLYMMPDTLAPDDPSRVIMYYTTVEDTVLMNESRPLTLADSELDNFFRSVKENDRMGFIALYADADIAYGRVVNVLSRGSEANVKVVLATNPASRKHGGNEPVVEAVATEQEE